MSEKDSLVLKAKDLIEVLTSSDGMYGYIKIHKPQGEYEPIQEEDLLSVLKENKIVYGIKDKTIEKFAKRPIFGIKIEVARGEDPVDGENGYVIYFVQKSSEYKPEFSEDGKIDYKKLDYFQLAKEGQVLCEIVKETKGTDGTSIFGVAVPGRDGLPPVSPKGKNTEYNEDETKLIASCDGIVRYIRDIVDINDVLMVSSNVDQTTGNIDFSGDVMIKGDICYGFSVKSGGNVKVKGVIEGAALEAEGDVHIAQGINGGGGQNIHIGGDLYSPYIENADIVVEGNIKADYIIDSNVYCYGDIELSGKKELVIGGNIKLHGDLTAKDIGNENERITRIDIVGTEIIDTEAIDNLIKEKDEDIYKLEKLSETLEKIKKILDPKDDEMIEQFRLLNKQKNLTKAKIVQTEKKLDKIKEEKIYEYKGIVTCKRAIYQGTRIYFGEERFRFNFNDIQHCTIYWHEGEIVQGIL